MQFRTWHGEAAVVAAILFTVAVFRESRIELLGALAVFTNFLHMQVSSRMAEQQTAEAIPTVECYRALYGYQIAKELLWITYFVLLKSYSALLGCGIFLAYPVWRRWWRARRAKAEIS